MRTRYISHPLHLESSTALYSQAVARMPAFLSGLVFALLTSNALTFGLAGSAFAISAISYGIVAAAALALQFAFQKTPAAPQPSDVQSNIRQEISSRRRVYGRYLIGSVIVFGFRRGEKSYVLHYLCEGPIAGYVSFRLDKKPVTLDEDGFVTETQYQVGGRSRVQILTTLGTMTDEPFQEILDAFPELDTPLKPFRQRGCAMALQIVEQVPQANLQDVYPNNMPSFQAVIDGLNDVYDPRDASTGLTDNAGLCLLAETADVYGIDPGDEDEVNVASFAAFADRCDEDVALKAGGTEKRWRCSGTVQLNAENEDRITAISSVCNAEVYIDPQGRIAVREKMRSTPGIALRAKNGDHLTMQLEGGRPLQKRFNTAKVSYVDPALNYKANEVRWRHQAYFEDDGEELPSSVPATLCPSATQAQRIAKLAVFESNPDYVGQLTSGPQGLDLIEDYVFTLDLSPEDPFERVAAATGVVEFDAEQMTVSTGFVIFGEGATDWDPEIDEQDTVEIPPSLPSNVDEVTLDVTPTVALMENSAPVLKFAWVAAGAGTLPDSYSQQVQVSAADADDWHDATVNQENNTAVFSPVADGGAYDWRIRNIAAGRTFDWQLSTSPVTVTLNAVPPGALVSFGVTGGLGRSTLTFATAAGDNNLARIIVYRVPTGVTLDKAVHTKIRLAAAPGTSFSYIDGDATVANLLSNASFDADANWTKGTGWTIAAGKATHASGTAGNLTQSGLSAMTAGTYRTGGVVSGRTAGTIQPFVSAATQLFTAVTTNGQFLQSKVITAGPTSFGYSGGATFDGSIDGVALFKETAACAPQGTWDYYAFPVNISGVEGPAATPVTGIVIV